MQDVFDIYTIIFLALAVFIFLRLRSVLGQRTGRERPPYDPFSARDAVRGSTGDKVVTLPTRGVESPAKPAEPAEPVDRWKDIAPPRSAAPAGLRPGPGGRQGIRPAPLPDRRARRLRDDRHGLRARRPPHVARTAVEGRL